MPIQHEGNESVNGAVVGVSVANRLPFDAFQALALVVLRANGRQQPVYVGQDIALGLCHSLWEEGYVQSVGGTLWATSKGLAYVRARSLDWSAQ